MSARYFIQDTGSLRPRIHDTLHRPAISLGVCLQLRHEAILHKQ
jgi:hypothetical protein